jgi:hypothetical protein
MQFEAVGPDEFVAPLISPSLGLDSDDHREFQNHGVKARSSFTP